MRGGAKSGLCFYAKIVGKKQFNCHRQHGRSAPADWSRHFKCL